MKVEVTQLLSDIKFFKEHIEEITFMRNDGTCFKGFPSIVNWTQGEIVVKVTGIGSGVEAIVKELKNRLDCYGVDVRVTGVNDDIADGVKFKAKAGDDIISVLAKARANQLRQNYVGKLEQQLTGLNLNVDQLIKQLPYVQRGVFSRGVNKFKRQVDVLKKIREEYTNENRR